MSGPWIQSMSGGPVDLLTPQAEQIVTRDIAVSLARMPRFNGHMREDAAWSVAEHSMVVMQLVMSQTTDRAAWLYALLHDAHEAYVGDIVTPVKRALEALGGWRLDALVEGLDRAIYRRFGLPGTMPFHIAKLVKAADLRVLHYERQFLEPSTRPGWPAPDPNDGFLESSQLIPCGSDWRATADNFERTVNALTEAFHAA